MLGVVPVIALVGACAHPDARHEQELSRLRRQVHTLNTRLARANKDIRQLDERLTLLAAGRSGRPRAAKARVAPEPVAKARPAAAAAPRAPSSVAAMPDLPVVRLGGASTGASSDEGALDDGGPPIMIKVGPDGPAKLPVDRKVLEKPDPVLDRKPAQGREGAMRRAYERALSKLRKDGRPSEARVLFRRFLKKYANSSLRDNALFWQAECSKVQGQHSRAIDEFLVVVERYPRSAKVPDALLRVATSWEQLGKPAKAREVFRRIVERYPDTEAGASARRALAVAEVQTEG